MKRLAVLFLAMLLLILPAACSSPKGADGSPAPQVSAPRPAIVEDKFTITLLTYPNQDLSGISYLQRLLNERGWGVRFTTLAQPHNEFAGSPPAWQTIEENATIAPPTDGYVVDAASAKQLLKDGFTQDLAAILPGAAPALYDKCKESLGQSVPGVPAGFAATVLNGSMALFLEKDVADALAAPVGSMSDVLALVEKNDSVRITTISGFGCNNPMDAWAGEQGYYPLFLYGIDGMLYAGFDDPSCAPVPLEAIPGFPTYFSRCYSDFKDGHLVMESANYEMRGEGVNGYIGNFGKVMELEVLSEHSALGMDYVAYPLAGCYQPAPTPRIPSVSMYVAVPASSSKAALVASFVQWALTDPANYMLVNYGVEDMDYRMEGSRVAMMINGKDLDASAYYSDMAGEPESKAYHYIKPGMIGSNEMEPLTVLAPSNYEDIAALKLPMPPIWEIEALRNWQECRQQFSDVQETFTDVVEKRQDLLNIEYNLFATGGLTSAECLDALAAMATDTQKLVDAYAARIQQLRDGQAQ
jgi:hypothetical protein